LVVTVAIADQDELWGAMAARAVTRDPALRLIGTATSADVALQLLEAGPSVVLLAEDLPGRERVAARAAGRVLTVPRSISADALCAALRGSA
jgi:hypothetical protein